MVVAVHSFRGFCIISCRNLTTSQALSARRSRVPYDRRFPVTGKDVNQFTKGGNPHYPRIYSEKIAKKGLGVHETGYKIRGQRKGYVNVPEMIPELIVPHLTGFKLKPYVSYKVPQVHQTEFTAKNLFDACYKTDLIEQFKTGQLIQETSKNNSAHDSHGS